MIIRMYFMGSTFSGYRTASAHPAPFNLSVCKFTYFCSKQQTKQLFFEKNVLVRLSECTAEPTLLCTFSVVSLFGNTIFCIFANRN